MNVNTNNTVGALLIGILVSCVLFGITTTQAYMYYSRFQDDNKKLKYFVAFIWIVELSMVVSLGDILYTFAITDYGDLESIFIGSPRPFAVSVFFTGIIGATVQGFFAYRIYTLSNGGLIVPIFSWTLCVLRLALNTTLFGGGMGMSQLASYEERWGPVAIAAWSITVANDVTNTTALVYLLYRNRSLGYDRTTALVDKIITWTLATGLLTSLCNITAVICFLTMKTNLVWVGIYAVEARLFSNSLFASLNGRSTLRAMGKDSTAVTVSTGFSHNRRDDSSANMEMNKVPAI